MFLDVEDVRKFASKFAALNEAGIDVLESLSEVAEKSRSLLKLGGPMGSLIAAGLDIVFDVSNNKFNISYKI